MYADPPAGWRPGSEYSDGHARLIMGTVGGGGALNQGAPASYLTPNSPNVHPIIAEREPIYSDPVVDWIWRHMPGGEAQAFVPAAVYGAGAVVTTVVRSGASRAAIPAFLKFAGHAGRDAARQGYKGAAVGLFMSMIGAAGLGWVWDQATRQWMKPQDDAVPATGVEWEVFRDPPGVSVKRPTAQLACQAACPLVAAGFDQTLTSCEFVAQPFKCVAHTRKANGEDDFWWLESRSKPAPNCPVGWYWTPAGCLATINNRPLTQKEFEDGVESLPWPDQLPEHLPEGVPVTDPVINPLPSPWDKPQPYFWPIGDPVKNPQFDPTKQPSKENPPQLQPGRRVTGSPAPGEPWRVDVQPTDRPIDDPNEEQNPSPDPTIGPEDPASAPAKPDKGDKDRQPGLCELFPNISACQPLDRVEDQPIEKKQVDVSATPAAGWGGAGTCPAARHVYVAGHDVPIPFDLFCTFMEGIRPILLAMAWLGAAFTLVGAVRGAD